MDVIEKDSWDSTNRTVHTVKVAVAPVLWRYVNYGQVVVQCPWCTETHLHGEGDGHRVSHCTTKDIEESARKAGVVDVGGYEIVGSAKAVRDYRS